MTRLLRSSRKTECDAKQFLIFLAVRAAPFALLIVAAASAASAWAAAVAVDSDRGEQLFTSLSCVQCHSVNGVGGNLGPDLGRRVARNMRPAELAATMWNHAPTMWTAMRVRQIEAGDLNSQAAADLMAYFYSARFFDKPGNAARGKQLFTSDHCANCHGLTTAKLPAANPVSEWQALGHPINLAAAMWNHGPNMKEEFAKQKVVRPYLFAQDLTDILVYLRNIPETRNAPAPRFFTTNGANGQALFESKGCVKCHFGKLQLEPRLKGKTLTEIAVDMWNHQPKMAEVPPTFEEGEMRDVISYLWSSQFFEDSGNASAGKRAFISKRCVACHNDASTDVPKLVGSQHTFSSIYMVSALWHHGPTMLSLMKSRNILWPRFEGTEMSDLIAYLNLESQAK